MIYIKIGLLDFVVYHVCRDALCGKKYHERYRSKNPLKAWEYLQVIRIAWPASRYTMKVERPS